MARGREGGLLGHTLGHYSLVALLGTGGMAEVYRARDQHLPRDVAEKSCPYRWRRIHPTSRAFAPRRAG